MTDLVKLVFFFLFFFEINQIGFSQSNQTWLLADDIQISFKNGSPEVSKVNNNIPIRAENSSILCDENGSVQFYTVGEAIWDGNHKVIQNGDDLGGNKSTTQGTVVIQSETNPSLLHFFTLENAGTDDGSYLFHSILDISQNGGQGEMIQVRKPLWENLTEKMISMPDPCGGAWIVVHERDNNRFLSFHLQDDKMDVNPIISEIGSAHNLENIYSWSGQMVADPASNILAVLNLDGLFEFVSFNHVSGRLTYLCTIDDGQVGLSSFYSGAFSPDGQFFYQSEFGYNPNIERNTTIVTQYAVSKMDRDSILASKVVVGYLDNTTQPPTFKLGPDEKIYLVARPYSSLHRIEFPNRKGMDCHFQHEYLDVGSEFKSINLPQDLVLSVHRNWFSLPSDTLLCSFDTLNLNFSDIDASFVWSDGYTGAQRTISAPGQYIVAAEDSLGCTHSDTFNLEIYDTNLSQVDTMICPGDFLIINGDIISEAGSYHSQGAINDDCSEDRTINVAFFPQESDTIFATIQEGHPFYWGDSILTAPGIYDRTEVDQNGCLSLQYLALSAENDEKDLDFPFIPNAFTPNGDNINDIFAIQAPDYETIHLNIFDRWGNQVYAASGPNCQWNGLVDSNRAESGVYLYQFILKGPQGKTKQRTGTVNLIQ
ncbi:MAG: gliding motility-associated C-terminal domain-containing protein [Saprospiraceae bacterium]|nr:gliding motility-associated C-terminal domain-containing protein [Saprospiraceae bacterium]